MAPDAPAIRVRIPQALRAFWAAPASIDLAAGSLAELLEALGRRHPGLASRIVDDAGRVRRHVNVFVNEDPVSGQEPRDVPLRAGDTVHIIPSIAGGAQP